MTISLQPITSLASIGIEKYPINVPDCMFKHLSEKEHIFGTDYLGAVYVGIFGELPKLIRLRIAHSQASYYTVLLEKLPELSSVFMHNTTLLNIILLINKQKTKQQVQNYLLNLI